MMNVALNNCSEIFDIPVNRILPNPYQPRRTFDRESMEELTRSVRQYGVLQPVSVRLINGTVYELVMGERRLRAAKLAGFKYIPAMILDISDRDSAALSLMENIQRRQLNYIEEAEAMKSLMEDFNISQTRLSHILGKSSRQIAMKLRLLRLSPYIKEELIRNNFSEGHARALLKLNREQTRKEVLERAAKYGLNVRRTEELVENTIKEQKEIGIVKKKPVKKVFFSDVKAFTDTVTATVEQMAKDGIGAEYEIRQLNGSYEIKIKINTEEN